MACTIKTHYLNQELEYIKRKPYECNICDTVFPSKVLLLYYFKTLIGENPYSMYDISLQQISKFVSHLTRHKGDKSYQSDSNEACGETYNSESNDSAPIVDTYYTKVPGENVYICKECGEDFSTKAILRKHLRTHTGLRPYKCKICLNTYLTLNNLKYHLKKQHHEFPTESDPIRLNTSCTKVPGEKKYICKECGAEFPKKMTFYKHLRTHSWLRPYNCKKCKNTYITIGELKDHQKRQHTEVGKYKCTTCDKTFSKSSRLKIHFETHIDKGERQKPYQCDLCEKAYFRKDHLNLHKKSHTGDKPCLCTQCAKSFLTNAELKAHMRTHTGEKPYRCEQCGLNLTTKQILLRHIETHTLDRKKSYQCDHCCKFFHTAHCLAKHKKTHSGDKPYKCSYCEMYFATKASCVRHERQHTGEKPFKCSQCSKKFSRPTKCCQGLPNIREPEVSAEMVTPVIPVIRELEVSVEMVTPAIPIYHPTGEYEIDF